MCKSLPVANVQLVAVSGLMGSGKSHLLMRLSNFKPAKQAPTKHSAGSIVTRIVKPRELKLIPYSVDERGRKTLLNCTLSKNFSDVFLGIPLFIGSELNPTFIKRILEEKEKDEDDKKGSETYKQWENTSFLRIATDLAMFVGQERCLPSNANKEVVIFVECAQVAFFERFNKFENIEKFSKLIVVERDEEEAVAAALSRKTNRFTEEEVRSLRRAQKEALEKFSDKSIEITRVPFNTQPETILKLLKAA